MKTESENTKTGWGGARQGAGRHRRLDKDQWGQITIALRRDTLEKLRVRGGYFFGRFLQSHLDKHPFQTQDEAHWRQNEQFKQVTLVLRKDTIAALRALGGPYFGRYLQAHLDQYPIREKNSITTHKQGPPDKAQRVRAA
jgi:hypothetical protein